MDRTGSASAPHIVIIGGGFGGLYAAKALRHANARVTLVDRRNHHLFQPLLYQVATAALNPSDIAAPIRHVLRDQDNTEVLLASVEKIDVAARKLVLDRGELAYDYLIVAAGATHSYFGHSDWAEQAPGLKTIEDALTIRRKIFFAYEAAERETDEAARKAWLTFVVVGAGPTGVELAGALAEISRHGMERDFRRFDPEAARILLVEGRDRVLPNFPESLAPKAAHQLERLGVEIATGVRVTKIDAHGVDLEKDGRSERLDARTILWAAGVATSPLAKGLGGELDRAGRVKVKPDLSVPGNDRVYVIGDLAYLEQDGEALPGLAPVAMQQGRHAAANVMAALHGEATTPFRYHDRGSLATIGRAAAVGTVFGMKVSGFIAWMVWSLVHLMYLVGFRNRVFVMAEWLYSYVSYRRGARLITGEELHRLKE
jgi:NADH dehydrogenase